MRFFSEEAVARTLSIPERTMLKVPPHPSEVELLMPTFRKLSVFKREVHPVEDALEPLCTLAELSELSHEDHQSLARRVQFDEIPCWSQKFEQWTDRAQVSHNTARHGFLNLIEDLVEAALQDLGDTLRVEHLEVSEHFASLLIDTLPTEALTEIVLPTALLVYKRNYAEDTLEEFAKRLTDDNIRANIYEEFPLVARLVTEVLEDWCTSTIKLVDNIFNDKDILWECFSFDVEKISSFHANLGDRHKNGATVTIIEAGDCKVVYKPRVGFGEILIAEICEFLHEIDDLLPLQPLIVERDGYLWQEYVAPKDFNPTQAPLIAKKLGVLNAIFYFLMADDMHHENVQICGENVAVLDAECVLNVFRPIDFMTVDVENVGARVLADAAYSVGIVPQPINSKDSVGSPLDISVIGYKPGGVVGLNVPQLSKNEAGELTLVNGPAKFNNQDPIGARSSLLQCGSDFIDGFRAAAESLLRLRDEIIHLIDNLTEVVVRVLPRPTMIYSKILLESFHPTFMRDAALRDACLCKLLPRFYGKPYRSVLISGEMSALRNSRIPYTELDLKRDELKIGEHRIPLYLDALGKLLSHIRRIDEDEIDRQCCYLDMAFASAVLRSSRSLHTDSDDSFRNNEQILGAGVQERLERLIVQGVERSAKFLIRSEGEVGFATMNALAPDCWVMGPAGMDLYNGLAGIQLMFEAVNRTSFGSKYRDLFQEIESTGTRFGAAVTLDSASIEKNANSLNVGFFDQLSGIALLQYFALQQDVRRNHASDSLQRSVLMLCAMVPHDNNFDIISGSAGAIFLGCSISNSDELPAALSESCNMLVKLSIDRLLASVKRTEEGAFWPTEDNPFGLTGLSHGSVGIAAALVLGATQITYRVEECIEVVSAALTWERNHFDKNIGWADLRVEGQNSAGAKSLQAWCHGSGGAYIARSIIKKYIGEFSTARELDLINGEISYAVDNLAAKTSDMTQVGGSDCLCHGTIGNLLILRHAVNSGYYNEGKFETLLLSVLRRIERDGWRLGGLPGLHSNSFMMGLPGIVWGLLSLYSPNSEVLDPLLLGL